MVKRIIIAAAVMALCACNTGIYDLLGRTASDPFTEKPLAVSFKESQTVILSWSFDPAADEYILERALDGTQIVYEEIYRGQKLMFSDAGLPDQNMYLYRLAKRRGNREFPFSDPVLGVSSVITRDIHEDNGDKENASYLGDTTLVANMYYYRSYSGFILCDEDWYFTDIPAGWIIIAVINDSKAPPGVNSHFKLYIENREISMVTSDMEIEIPNYDTSPLRCYMKVFPYEYQYISEMPDTEIGGNIIQYTIRVVLRRAL